MAEMIGKFLVVWLGCAGAIHLVRFCFHAFYSQLI